MFNQKQDIFSQNWLDVVFDGRNKQYGAYVLRRDASKDALIALLIASSVFIIALLAPLIKTRLSPVADDRILAPRETTRIVELAPPPPIDLTSPQPPAVAPPAPRTSQVRMPPPRVVKADQVITEEPPSTTLLKLANPGPTTIDGDPDAAIHIDGPVGYGHGDAAITEATALDDTPFSVVEIEPMFPGGMEAFSRYVRENYRYPAQAAAHGVKGKVILTFIVECDGSLTAIKVIRDLKFGTGEEAVRLLKASPKWRAGVQNGRPVRVAYTLPIGLDIN